MSPVWLVLAAPALLLPLVVMLLTDDDPMPSLVEQAVSALPIPGDASESGRVGRLAPLGDPNTRLPPSLAASLYNNSARGDAARLAQQADTRDLPVNPRVADYALLHPRGLADEDMLVGDYALLLSTPTGDLSWAIFNAFCNGTAEEGTASLGDLPIDPNLVTSLVNFVPTQQYGAVCRRLAG